MKQRDGFTLIEVLVSLVILSVAIVTVLQAFETAIVALGASRDKISADMLIQQKISALKYPGTEGERGALTSSSGTFDGHYQSYYWDMKVTAVASPSATEKVTNTLSKVLITVGRKGIEREYSAATYILE